MSEETNKPRDPRGRGRRPGYHHTRLVRERIQVSMLVSRLTRHVRGELELTMTQLRAAEILLRKALPDLSSIDYTGEIRHRHVTELSDAELIAIAERGIEGDSETTPGEGEPRGVH